jgi:hypothetical protein
MEKWTWVQYKQWIAQKMQNGYQYLFRGQENPRWKLQTSFHRAIQNNPNITLEIYLRNIIPELNNILVSQGFENYLLYDSVNLNSFLAKLQHHGFPTPLLDWTYNPYIAVYFAIEKINTYDSEGAFSIFIFDYIQWITTNIQPIDLFSPNFFVSTFKPNYANNPRLITQNSILTVTNVNDIQEYLVKAESLQGKKFLYKINIDKTEIPQIKSDLEFMGITKKKLFPNLDDVCKEMALNFFQNNS